MPKKVTKRIVSDQEKHDEAVPEDIKTGEQTIGASEANLESDDNVLDAAHEAGLYENQDEEHPGEIGIAKEVDKDEKDQWKH